MSTKTPTHIILRFRDLVTELGGTVLEHRRLIRRYGHVWWGWWRRQAEYIPRSTLAELFGKDGRTKLPIVLFDAGTLKLYTSHVTQVVVSPSVVGIQTPEFASTPEYYIRGHYPVWFRLEDDILPIELDDVCIIGTPTKSAEFDRVPDVSFEGEKLTLDQLRDDQPTLWLARFLDPAR